MKLVRFNYSVICALIAICFVYCKSESQTSNWTHFRGSNLNGISPETGVPTVWNDSLNVVWKTGIHGKGWSSPVVYDNQIWVTTANDNGKQLFAVCIDFKSGKILFDKMVFESDTVYSKHGLNSYATPTPCIEKKFVYLNFGNYGTVCMKTNDASIVWKRTDLKCNHVQGAASSPIIYKDLLILHYEGSDIQYIIALNKKTGETVWKVERPQEYYSPLPPIGKKAYTTPLIINVNGEDLLISNGAAVCIAYNPNTGEEVWRIPQGVDSTIAMPFAENGMVYFYTSFVVPPDGEKYAELLAVNPKGKGNIKESNVIWHVKTPVLQMLTPLIKDGLIYTIDTKATMICIDAKTGTTVWTEKLKGNYNSSPVYADGNIYFSSTKGETIVIKQDKKYEKVAENKLSGEIWATPVIVNKSILIRTNNFLYCIRN